MNARTAFRLLSILAAAGWGLSLATGNLAGGLAHLLAVAAVFAFVAQARVQVIPTPFEVWQARESDRRSGGRR